MSDHSRILHMLKCYIQLKPSPVNRNKDWIWNQTNTLSTINSGHYCRAKNRFWSWLVIYFIDCQRLPHWKCIVKVSYQIGLCLLSSILQIITGTKDAICWRYLSTTCTCFRHFISCSKLVLYSGYFKGGNFHEFHKSITICESFTLKMFTESNYYQVFLMISETSPPWN